MVMLFWETFHNLPILASGFLDILILDPSEIDLLRRFPYMLQSRETNFS